MKCPKCSHENSEGKKFCESCGEKLVLKCRACSAENPAATKFCEKCGEPISQQVAQGTQQASKSIVEPLLTIPTSPKGSEAAKVISPPKTPEEPKIDVDVTKASVSRPEPATQAPQVEQAPPQTKKAEEPISIPVQTTHPEKKGGMGISAVIAGVLVVGAGAYFLMKPSAEGTKPAALPITQNTAPTPGKAASSLPSRSESVTASQVAERPVSQAAEVTLDAASKSAEVYLKKMLEGAKTNSDATIQASVDAIKQISVPPKGARKIARAANDEGLAALKNNALDDAVAKFKEGIAADSSDQEIINNLGHTYILQGKHAEAIAALNQALTLAPTRSSAWANLGFVFAKEAKTEESVPAYLLAYKFSQNQQKTRAFLIKQSQEDPDQKVRDTSTRVLGIIGIE